MQTADSLGRALATLRAKTADDPEADGALNLVHEELLRREDLRVVSVPAGDPELTRMINLLHEQGWEMVLASSSSPTG